MDFPRLIASPAAAVSTLLLGAVCAAGALAAQGGRFDDTLDLLTHLAPMWLAGGLVVLLAAVTAPRWPRRIALAVLGLAATLSAADLMAPEYLRSASPRAPADAPNQLKLIQFNAWGILTSAIHDPVWIASQNPDVIVMEDGTGLIRENLRKQIPYYVTCDEACGVMIYSRAKPIATGLDPPAPGVPWPRVTRATFAAPGGPITVVGVYYHWPTDPKTHAAARNLAQVLRRFPKDRLIIAGDFNSTPWSFARRREDATFGIERRTRALFSWPQGRFTRFRVPFPFPVLPIDHVYAGSAWRTVEVRRGKDLSSDHAPIIAVLALQPAASPSR
jgi:endonuclease/exonuclease/phosphatase (EEP) superfamily protein YafD